MAAPKRDAAAPYACLLKLAIAEFAAKGYSGARMDAVAGYRQLAERKTRDQFSWLNLCQIERRFMHC
ncbi:MAG: hypothetical protein H7315_01895 [Herminiimonas sp.]|nr:hypothetical protein [Herminiimonas sp.]